MDKKQAKRFYKSVSVEQMVAGYQVKLDERVLKSPAKASLVLPNKLLADEIAKEFDAQIENISPETMPIFSLASTAIDRVATQRDTLDSELVRYGQSDLICYRCSQDEDEFLAKRQEEMWGAIQQWMLDTFDISLLAFDGIMPHPQPDSVLPKLEDAVKSVDNWRYVGLYRVTTLSGSLSLGLRFVTSDFAVDDLMAHAFLDEYYQEEKWGVDEWAVERRDNIKTELADASRFLSLLQ